MVAVLDEEEAFVDRLTGYVNKKRRNGIRLTGFTNSEKLKEYLKTNNISAVLCNEEAESFFGDEKIQYLFVFGKDIKKYQAADVLLEEIRKRISENKSTEEVTLNIFAVCSANADQRVEMLGRQIAEEKGIKEKTLLINCFPFFKSGFDLENNPLSEVIYQIRRNAVLPENITFERKGVANFDVLEGVDYWGDLSVLTDGDMRILLETMGKEYGYKNIVIVFDLLMPVFETILELSNSIYYPEPESMLEETCFEELKKQITFAGNISVEKIVVCRGRGYRENE